MFIHRFIDLVIPQFHQVHRSQHFNQLLPPPAPLHLIAIIQYFMNFLLFQLADFLNSIP